jgi:hypothetical protein
LTGKRRSPRSPAGTTRSEPFFSQMQVLPLLKRPKRGHKEEVNGREGG